MVMDYNTWNPFEFWLFMAVKIWNTCLMGFRTSHLFIHFGLLIAKTWYHCHMAWNTYVAALQTLVIGACEKLDLSMAQGLVDTGFSLQSLYIADLPKLKALPQWLLRESANTCKNLTITGCENLTSLAEWHDVTSLEKLEIKCCPKLSSLPKTMKRLKELKIVLF